MTLKTLSKITRALLYALMALVAALMAALFVSGSVRGLLGKRIRRGGKHGAVLRNAACMRGHSAVDTY